MRSTIEPRTFTHIHAHSRTFTQITALQTRRCQQGAAIAGLYAANKALQTGSFGVKDPVVFTYIHVVFTEHSRLHAVFTDLHGISEIEKNYIFSKKIYVV